MSYQHSVICDTCGNQIAIAKTRNDARDVAVVRGAVATRPGNSGLRHHCASCEAKRRARGRSWKTTRGIGLSS